MNNEQKMEAINAKLGELSHQELELLKNQSFKNIAARVGISVVVQVVVAFGMVAAYKKLTS